ncbi:malate synthase G [Sphingorhabdus lutea]|uniref:Malate synthase G n=1 Tax=Sphingorhabdus lutea TaxID=1913578 RepID=A0A1L3JAS9_9SPHN|nr:malate synthase G [Sphingorhabdus lutea]APG62237.1 malate synthase G [Sphingorhabdus lutea]
MTQYVNRASLCVDSSLAAFLEEKAIKATGISADEFWAGFADLAEKMAPINRALVQKRADIQSKLDEWHRANPGPIQDQKSYQSFLRSIGYLVDEPAPFQISTQNVDPEIATMAGPQLVVPSLNDRFVLNAANARWGSLYDALYGTDALDAAPAKPGGYDEARGAAVIKAARDYLDRLIPLKNGSWTDYEGGMPQLANAEMVGTNGDNYLIRHHGLHLEIIIDKNHPIGRGDKAGIADILVEAALTTIIDMEDSVAAVDAQDKVLAYSNWLGLMRGDLSASFSKGGKTMQRHANPDRHYKSLNGEAFTLPGRSLMFVRNVGHLMTNPAILLSDGSEIPEGIMDAAFTSLIAMHDLKKLGNLQNSRAGSIYIVKPKMHGPDEAAFTNNLFNAVEDILGLERHTIKVGVMDEERRTSANLAACIYAVKERIVFINTGFLDRTGDEMHSAMHGGAMIRKADMKNSGWIAAYEQRNVAIGLACGLSGKAQIGKGMWAMPDLMGAMMEQKIGHPKTGANTAWVPSPTAATLHALHYHMVNVFDIQQIKAKEAPASLDALLTVPFAPLDQKWSEEEILAELENNAQGILGYVVRWIDHGVGCSKVPDINDIGLMEDRATLRISSQHMANWLLHGICTIEQIDSSFEKMAAKVDAQNSSDPEYQKMSGNLKNNLAYQAAMALVLKGTEQPSGYTEPLLHRYRLQFKGT